jgi:hypothetical protein
MKYLFNTLKGYLTCPKFLLLGVDGFTSPPAEGVLRIFITIKNSSPSAGFQTANLPSNCKHANHYITKDDMRPATFSRNILAVGLLTSFRFPFAR